MTYIAKPKVHHPGLPKNAIGLTRRDYEGAITTSAPAAATFREREVCLCDVALAESKVFGRHARFRCEACGLFVGECGEGGLDQKQKARAFRR